MRTEINNQYIEKLQRAFQQAVGKSNWDAIVPLTQGMAESSLGVYKISFGNQHYVAKLKSLDKPRELANEFEHMKLASALNACPKLHYANAEEGISIVDFIENQSMKDLVNGEEKEINAIAAMLAKLHNQASFAKGKSIFDVADEIFAIVSGFYKSHDIVAKSHEIITELKPMLDDVDDFRACHRELHQANLLFDGTHYLAVDWEPSGLDSFYVDLAGIAIHFLYKSPDAQLRFLQAYLGREPKEEEKLKLDAMSTVSYLFYGLIFLASSLREYQKLVTIKNVDALPEYGAFLSEIGTGEKNLKDPNVCQQLGFVFLRQGLKMQETLQPHSAGNRRYNP